MLIRTEGVIVITSYGDIVMIKKVNQSGATHRD